MSISPANPDAPVCGPATPNDGAGETAPLLSGRGGRGKDDITVVQVPACPPVPGFLSADARPPSGGAQPAAPPTLETEVRKLQAALNTAARPLPAKSSPAKNSARRNNLPAGVVRGAAAPGRQTMLSRRSFRAVVGMTLATMTIAAVGAYVFVILPQTDDWEVAELPPAASREPAAPPATALPSGSETGVTASETTRQSQPPQAPPADAGPTWSPLTPPPVAPLPPAPPPESRPVAPPKEVAALPMSDEPHAAPAPPPIPEPSAMTAREPAAPESRPAETPMEVAALLMNDDSHAAPAPSAIPERSAMTAQEPAAVQPPATQPAPPAPPALAAPAPPAEPGAPMAAAREPVPPATHEPQADRPAADRASPGVGIAAAPHGFESAETGARYPAGAGQKLSVDRLRMAHTEIFIRKGFREDALRVSSGAAETGTRVAVTDPHRQYLTTAQLRRLSPDQLDLVRYEILARRGKYFKEPALRAYFEQFAWYRPYAWDVPLTRVERANIDMIQSYQQTMLAPGPAARTWRASPM